MTLSYLVIGIYRSCKEVKQQLKTTQNKEYMLQINGRPAKVYCYKMDMREPEEFVSLKAGRENFAEIYDRRLRDLESCPYYGERNDDCDCVQISFERSGHTVFWKVRLNITSMQIIGW